VRLATRLFVLVFLLVLVFAARQGEGACNVTEPVPVQPQAIVSCCVQPDAETALPRLLLHKPVGCISLIQQPMCLASNTVLDCVAALQMVLRPMQTRRRDRTTTFPQTAVTPTVTARQAAVP